MTTAAVSVEGVHAGFPTRPVLHGVSLAARPGEVVAVVGLNGAGKSVLGRTISGLVPVSQGRVLLDGDDVTRASPRARVRRGLHHLSQRRGLVPDLTVAENVRIALHAAGRRANDAALVAHPVLRAWATRRAGTLSGGEQAQVALARAEVLAPAVLIADEPTAGLAPAALDGHGAALRGLAAGGASIVLIEQNLAFARAVAHRLVVLRTGTVALDSNTAELTEESLSTALVG